MKILETIVLSQKPNYFAELMMPLAPDKINVMGIDVYRVEIDDELIIMLYDLNMEEELPADVIRHLQPHLGALLILSDGNFESLGSEEATLLEEFGVALADRPIVLGIRSKKSELGNIPAAIIENGVYLSVKGRILFWDPSIETTKKRVLNTLWNALQVPA